MRAHRMAARRRPPHPRATSGLWRGVPGWSSMGWSALGWSFVCAGFLPVAWAAQPPDPVRIHVDSERGDDGPGRDGSSALPFRTVARALSRASELSVPATGDPGPGPEEGPLEVSIVIRAGILGREESFPLRVPGGLGALSLIGEPVGTKDVVLDCAERSAVLELDLEDAAPQRFSMEGLRVRGGRTGLSLVAHPGTLLDVRVADCLFEDQGATSVEILVGADATADCRISRASFRGASGGILAETGRAAHLSLLVEECRVEDLHGYGPEGRLGAGVDLHADPLAHVRATVERSRFHRVASAVQVTAAEADPEGDGSAAWLEVEVIGNLVVGPGSTPPADPSSCVPRSGVYLSLWPHHEVSLLVASNTFFGIDGPVIFHDNLDALRALDATVPLVFVNNLCRVIGAPSELDFETAGEETPGSGRTIGHNCLERSGLGAEGIAGNTSEDPLLVDPERGDFRLRPGSPAVDRGLSGHAEGLRVDLDGSCRRASPTCALELASYAIDIGAYELPGFCDVDVRPFKRGDCNGSGGALEISDAILVFAFLFLGEAAPPLLDACDANDDGRLEITDGIYVLSYLFLGGSSPPPPFPELGTDPTRDCLASA